ncbi:MAG: helix-turn-helix domain-containing protein [Promethearchaeota archaeon]
MRILKIKVPSNTILDFGLPNYFDVVDYIEVLQIYEYDSNNFFAMNKIIFKKGKIDEMDKFLRELFFAQSYKILEKKANEILCIMKQKNTSGFWPAFLSKSFALLPPIIFDPDAIVFGLIAKDDEVNTVLTQNKIFKSIEILSVANINETISNSINTMPRLTSRQKQIMIYATRNGYFKVPKEISTKRIAEHFQVSSSAILNHIQKAERSIMEYFFG